MNGTKNLLFERSRFPISEKSHAIKNHSALSIQLVLLILFDLREMRFKKCHLHWWFTLSETQTFYKALSQVGTDFSLMTPIFPNRTRRELKVCGCCWFELKRDFFLLTPVSCPLHEFYVHLLLARFLSFFFSFLLFLQSQPRFLSTSSSLPSSFPRHPFVIPLPPSLSSPPSFPFNLSSSLRPPSIHSSHFPFHRLLLPLYPPFPFSLLHTCHGLFTSPLNLCSS